MSVFHVVKLRAAAGKADELRPMLEAGKGFALTQDGCEAFDILQASDEPERFVMIERWATPEQHQKHFEENVVGSGVLDQVAALLSEPMEYGYHKEV